MSANEWKIKYYELKNKWISSIDESYRLGYEQGAKETQMEIQAQQMAEQQAMEAAMQQQAMMGGAPVDESGQPIPPDQMPPEMMGEMPPGEEGFVPPPEEVDPEKAAELDAYLGELEQMVAKGEKPSIKDLRKTIENISGIRKSQKEKWTKKVEKTTSAQKEFVDGILAKWSKDEKDLTKDLEDTIKKQGIKLED